MSLQLSQLSHLAWTLNFWWELLLQLCAAVGGKIRIDVEPRDRFGNTALFDATQELTVDVVKHGVPLHENSLFFMKQVYHILLHARDLSNSTLP